MPTKKRMRFTVGADPEIFLFKRDSKGKRQIVPAYEVCEGTKDKPQAVDFYGSILSDNVMLELNPTPQPTLADMFSWCRQFMQQLQTTLGMRSKGLDFHSGYVVSLNDETLKDSRAHIFGCSQVNDAYTEQSHPSANLGNTLLRMAGGHIHFGFDPLPDVPAHIMVQFCDAIFGLRAVAAGDVQPERRPYYGKAGSFRPTPYGFEYRVPSNKWLFNTRVQEAVFLQEGVFRSLLSRTSTSSLQQLYLLIDWNRVQNAVSTGTQAEAATVSDEVMRLVSNYI